MVESMAQLTIEELREQCAQAHMKWCGSSSLPLSAFENTPIADPDTMLEFTEKYKQSGFWQSATQNDRKHPANLYWKACMVYRIAREQDMDSAMRWKLENW